MSNDLYTGRFAPSPTGPLHLGSLLAALASWLEARSHSGRWLLRIENLDPPRESASAAAQIIDNLISHGLQWDEDISWQADRSSYYQLALDRLLNSGTAFLCSCSRRDLEKTDGNHRRPCVQIPPDPLDCAVRLKVDPQAVTFHDQWQGGQCFQPYQDGGDFVLKRRDGLWAYQLAVVVDDELQGITHVVRGADLLDSTPRHLLLQRSLGYRQLQYGHTPVVVDNTGIKLSKRAHAPALDNHRAGANLVEALHLLGQTPPNALSREAPPQVLDWALSHWQPAKLKGRRTAPPIPKTTETG